MGVNHSELKCEVISINYDFENKELEIYMEEANCVDMTGAIAFAERIDKDVKQIQTFAGDKTETCYVKSNGIWSAFVK